MKYGQKFQVMLSILFCTLERAVKIKNVSEENKSMINTQNFMKYNLLTKQTKKI